MRTKHWDRRLVEFIEKNRDTKFEWGKFDCCQFTGKAVEIITGSNLVEKFGMYKSLEGAQKRLKSQGYNNLLEALTDTLGKPQPVHTANRGDVVYLVFAGGPLIGICLGRNSLFVTPDGLAYHPTLKASKAFAIG